MTSLMAPLMKNAASSSRFPFGIPRGWFVVALSSELDAGPPRPLRALGRDLVLYRGESGAPHLVDAYCPHLGAHLGHGGCVEGESVRCPFHGWRFDETGRCTEVPKSPITSDKARLRTYPVKEQNGTIFAFYDPEEGAPWPLPVLEEESFTEQKTVHWKGLRSHPQEVFENTVDTAHIGPVHAGVGAALTKKPARDGERMVIDIAFQAPGDVVGMPGTINDVELTVSMIGLGVVVVDTFVRNVGVRARQRIHVTPIDDDTIDIRGIVQVKKGDDPAFTEELSRIFYEAYVEDFAKDFPIWENKRYLVSPLLSPADGPIGLYRRWCEQFYDRPPEARSEGRSEARPSASTPSPLTLLRTKASALIGPMRAGLTSWRSSLSPTPAGATPTTAAPTTAAPPTPEAASEAPIAHSAPKTSKRPRKVGSAEEYFETLPARFVPEASRGVDAVFQWELGASTFHATVRDGTLQVNDGPHAHPTVALVMAADDYVRVVNGDLDGTWAFTSGLGKVKGSLSAAMKMRSLFPA